MNCFSYDVWVRLRSWSFSPSSICLWCWAKRTEFMYMKNLEQSQPRVRTLFVINILLVGHSMSNAREGSPLGHRPRHHWAPACMSSPDFSLKNSYSLAPAHFLQSHERHCPYTRPKSLGLFILHAGSTQQVQCFVLRLEEAVGREVTDSVRRISLTSNVQVEWPYQSVLPQFPLSIKILYSKLL